MKHVRYNIIEIEPFQSGSGQQVRVFKVWEGTVPVYEAVNVWLRDGGTRCTDCSTMLTAMLANCPHTRAVRRYLKKQANVTDHSRSNG